MGKSQKKHPELNSWDRRPWPKCGDDSGDELYAATGAALSEWERLDATLCFLFAAFISVPPAKSARKAYSAVRTFEGRMEMLAAASGQYFSENPNDLLLEKYKEILKQSKKFSERRNEIAHACVENFQPENPADRETPLPKTFGLFPSFATFRHRDINDYPTYCYASPELEFFRQEFFKLRIHAWEVCTEIMKDGRLQVAQRSSLGKLREIYRSAANREQDESNQ